MKQLPSDKYFELIQSYEDWDKFVRTGMAWEVEPLCPYNWEEHLRLHALWLEHKEYDGS